MKNQFKLQQRKRLVLLILPLIGIPLLTLLFWGLDGGGNGKVQASPSGLRTTLPGAQLDSTAQLDKLSIYQQARKDSLKLSELEKYSGFGTLGKNAPEVHEQQVAERLERLQRELSRPQEYPTGSSAKTRNADYAKVELEVARLEKLMKGMQAKEADPEMQQLSQVLERIQEIQNPELALARLPKESKVLENEFLAIPASIAKNHKALQGSVVEMVLLDSVRIRGQLIPKGHLIYGLASFSNQRLNLEIKNIRLGSAIIPVDFTVFDRKDAMVGINAPEALLSDALGQGSTDAMNSIGLLGMSDNIGIQLAGAGMDAAKRLFAKKLKRIKQPLKKGYPLLLRDNSKRKP